MNLNMKVADQGAVLEMRDGDDLYMIALWRNAGADWSAEVFVNGRSLSRVFAADRITLLEHAESVIQFEMEERNSR